ncbi:MAG TPA: bis(5'-nucleosyl)-tetraphosphatase (symmetrical) YqeK [Chroococcales cyanobacterium]
MDPLDAILERISPKRRAHCRRVAEEAECLALHFGLDSEKAALAGLLHDCAREIPPNRMLQIAHEKGITLYPLDEEKPTVRLHGLLAAEIAREELGIEDEEILKAISSHTLGSLDMTPLEQVIFLADWIEPGRTEHPGLAEVRELAYHSLALATRKAMDFTLLYLIEREEPIHPLAVEARNRLVMNERKRIDR